MWNLPGSGIKPVSPALAGRFFITEPPGKPFGFFFSFGHTACYMGSLFPNQWWNPCPLQWKQVVSTTGPPGNLHILQLLIHSPVDELLEYWSIINQTTMNILVQVFGRHLFSFLLNKYCRMKWLGHGADACLISLKTATQLSKEMIPFYSPDVWNSICFMLSPTSDTARAWF